VSYNTNVRYAAARRGQVGVGEAMVGVGEAMRRSSGKKEWFLIAVMVERWGLVAIILVLVLVFATTAQLHLLPLQKSSRGGNGGGRRRARRRRKGDKWCM